MRIACAAFFSPVPRPTLRRPQNAIRRSLLCATTPSPTPPPKSGVSAAIFRRTSNAYPEVLLIQRGKPPNQYLWALPGGAQNLNESPLHAILRELQEEAAIISEHLELLPTPVNSLLVANGAWRLQVFAGVCTHPVHPVAGDDAMEARFFSLEDISRLQSVPDLESIVLEAADKVASLLKSL